MSAKELTPDLVLGAYELGIFPMGSDADDQIGFYSVGERCLFPIEGIRVSTSLRKFMRKCTWRISFDEAFEQVMRTCMRPPGHNWITEPLIAVFCEFHRLGWAHSVEVWDEDRLVGGAYGLAVGSIFCAESMFHRETHASKVALFHLVNHCRELGFKLFDAQVHNPHLESIGAYMMDGDDYEAILAKEKWTETPWSWTPRVTAESRAKDRTRSDSK